MIVRRNLYHGQRVHLDHRRNAWTSDRLGSCVITKNIFSSPVTVARFIFNHIIMMAPEQLSQPAHRASVVDHKRKLQCLDVHSVEATKPVEHSTTNSGGRSNAAERSTEPYGKTGAAATAAGCMRRCRYALHGMQAVFERQREKYHICM